MPSKEHGPVITITGLDKELGQHIFKLVANALADNNVRGLVRVEHAERPHFLFASASQVDEAVGIRVGIGGEHSVVLNPGIMLDGHFTLEELDGISYKLRGGV
jgi:hypothetical protein